MGLVFFISARVYLNAFKCYSDCHLKWMVSLKKKNDVLKLIRIKGFVMVIAEKKQTIFGQFASDLSLL